MAKSDPIQMLVPQATNANPASAYVDLSNAHMAEIIIHVTKGNAALTSFALEQANTAAGGGNKPLANNASVYSNLNATTGNIFTRRADAISYALDNAADGRGEIVKFMVDPALLDLAGGFRWLRFQIAAGNAANIASAICIIDPARYSV